MRKVRNLSRGVAKGAGKPPWTEGIRISFQRGLRVVARTCQGRSLLTKKKL